MPGSGSGVLTAFDYVTTRIVEVMRSDADERTKQPLAFPTANYTYPFSALNVTAAPQDGQFISFNTFFKLLHFQSVRVGDVLGII